MKLHILVPLFADDCRADDPARCDQFASGWGCFTRQVTITGTTDHCNFLSAQLDFSYARTTKSRCSFGSRKLVHAPNLFSAVLNAALAFWDTTAISDGDYILRLRVNLSDGTSQEVTVPIKYKTILRCQHPQQSP